MGVADQAATVENWTACATEVPGRGSLAQEQIEARLTHGGVAVLGEVMRRMANNPDLRQIFFGRLGDEVSGGDPPCSDSPPAPRGGRSEGRRVAELGMDGGPRDSRREAHGGDRRRVGDGGHRDEHGDHPYRHEPYGRDGGLHAEAPGCPGKARRNHGFWHVGRRVHRGLCAA